jgi:peroxiredoxin
MAIATALLPLLLAVAPQTAPEVAPPAAAPADPVAALLDEYAGAKAAVDAAPVVAKLLALLPGASERADDGWRFVLQHAVAADDVARAVAGITAAASDEKELAALARRTAQSPASRANERLLRGLLARAGGRDVRGWAAYGLAHDLLRFADDARDLAGADETLRARRERQLGAELAADLRARDPAALKKEGLDLLRRVSDEFYFVDNHRTGYLGQAADAELFDLTRLQPGMVVPEISGKDEDGTPFSLSDYRGKVVVVDFWGFWCPICRAHLPAERGLVARLKDEPFALVGVNSDSRKMLDEQHVYDKIAWRSFFDGGDPFGPIATEWGIYSWPTMFVIDAEGVIHLKTEDMGAVESKVDELMAALKTKSVAAKKRAVEPAPR